MPNLIHYTLNTADTFDCSRKHFHKEALKSVQPLVSRAIAEGQTQTALPSPLNSFTAKISTIPGAALFDVFDPEQMILSTNAVVWDKAVEAEVWEQFEKLYLRLAGQFSTLSVLRAPQCPASLPWLSTLTLPNPRIPSLNWLADFEQVLALALIKTSEPGRTKPKGFGK